MVMHAPSSEPSRSARAAQTRAAAAALRRAKL